MEPPGWFALLFAIIVLLAGYQAIRATVRAARARRDQHRLDEAGLTTTAQVTAVEPMQRSVNSAAGHPVWLRFHDRAGRQHDARDTSGLGGYVAREGTGVTVRYSPDDPELVRVEAVAGPHGSYPTRPDDQANRRWPAAPLLGLAVWLIVATGLLALWYRDDSRSIASGVIPVAVGTGGLVLLVATGLAGMRLVRERRRPKEETAGVVTEVWSESAGRGSVNAFTVHFATGDGREVHTRSPATTITFYPRPPQQVTVRYDPACPTRFEVVEAGYTAVLTIVVQTAVGLGLLLVGGLLTWMAFIRG